LNGLKEDLSPIENLQVNMRLAADHAEKSDVLDALEAIGVGRCANLPVRVLSQGQKRRVALARLWLTERKLWILDEPFAALDSASIDVLVARINHHLNNDGMAIITTHQDVVISAQSTQVLRLDL
jgi:heme exporter protein A